MDQKQLKKQLEKQILDHYLQIDNEGDFVRSILGDSYVNMTLENIDRNDPMAVYKQQGEFNMFLGITINNIKVALFAFAYGIFFGIGTIYILMQNAIMLGSF